MRLTITGDIARQAICKAVQSSEIGMVVSILGAGTTGVACMKAGRKFIGCEVDRAAFDLACQRIEAAAAQGSLLEPAQPVPEQQGLGI